MSVTTNPERGAIAARTPMLRSARRRPRRTLVLALAAVLLAGGLAAWVVVRDGGEAAAPAVLAPAGAPLTIQDIMPPLTRSGVAPGGIETDVTYAPTLFFQVSGQQLPASARLRPTLIFFLQENIHEGAMPSAPPAATLSIDGGASTQAYASTIVSDDVHHRITRLQFAATTAGEAAIAEGERHTLTLVLPAKDGSVAKGGTLTWRVPVPVPAAAKVATRTESAAATSAASGPLALSALARTLRKTVGGVRLGAVTGAQVDAIYATPKYFEAALPADAAARYAPGRQFVFVVSETSHTRELPAGVPPLLLHVGGKTYRPDLQDLKIASPHHQVAFVRFPASTKLASRPGVMTLELADGSSLRWALPLSFESDGAMSPFGLPWASILALLGGMLGAMWPCLFQLTVFFMPTLAGVGAEQAAMGDKRAMRRRIGRAAFFFVLGFTIVYTAAGALIGFAAQHLQDTSQFLTYQRYFGVAAGLVILFLALRVAVRGRAPLVCKMPLVPRMRSSSGATAREMMMAGLAFATGCMTCFGSALVIGMVVYVGLANSALYGAFILFLFSLGMGIPLGIAAMAMGRVMPLMARMERAMPWMALASALIMAGFAVLLISGNYMELSAWIYELA